MGYDTQAGSGRKVAAVLLIALGGFFLLAQLGFFSFSLMEFLWPFFVIVPGLAFLYPALRGGGDTAPLAIPGAIITGSGAILFYQNITGHWESWAYIWALYPVFLGLGMTLMGRRQGNRKTEATGRGFIRWGLIAFLVMGALFELFIFDNLGIGKLLFPIILILFGLWMLMGGGRRSQRTTMQDEDFAFESAPFSERKPKNRPSASAELRRQIDIALAKDDDLTPDA